MEAMTGNDNKKERNPLDRLADVFADDILNMSDAEILAEFRETHGDPEQNAREMRERFEKTLLVSNKKRLAAAKAGVAASRNMTGSPAAVIDITAARRWLRSIGPSTDIPQSLTLAARKESEMSDADILSTVEDLIELGIAPPGSDKDGKS